MSYLGAILLTAACTLFGVFLFQNLAGGETKIEQQLPKLYESDDAEFRRSLSSLLGPPIVEGNNVDTLLNGDQISCIGPFGKSRFLQKVLHRSDGVQGLLQPALSNLS